MFDQIISAHSFHIYKMLVKCTATTLKMVWKTETKPHSFFLIEKDLYCKTNGGIIVRSIKPLNCYEWIIWTLTKRFIVDRSIMDFTNEMSALYTIVV